MLSAKFKSEIKSAKTSQNLLEVDIDILDKKISSQRGKCGRGPKQGNKVAKKCLSTKKNYNFFGHEKTEKGSVWPEGLKTKGRDFWFSKEKAKKVWRQTNKGKRFLILGGKKTTKKLSKNKTKEMH